MDVAALTTLVGLPGSTANVEVVPAGTGPAAGGGREIVLLDGDLELRCPWLRPGDTADDAAGAWNGATVVLPWYDVESMFAEAVPSPARGIERRKFPVADDLLERGFGIVVVPWWAEEMGAGSTSRALHDRYGPAAEAVLDQGWRTGMGRSLRDILAVVEVLASQPDEAGPIGTWGHSLGGKLSLFTAAVDERVGACVTHELGFGWDHSNWWDPWYFGGVRPEFDCDAVLGLVAPRPVLYGAGHGFDAEASLAMVRSVTDADWRAEVVEHHNGHRPPPEVLHQTYDWLTAQLVD